MNTIYCVSMTVFRSNFRYHLMATDAARTILSETPMVGYDYQSHPDTGLRGLFSTETGQTWRPIYTGPGSGGAVLANTLFPAAECGKIRVRLNDGFIEVSAVSGWFESLGSGPRSPRNEALGQATIFDPSSQLYQSGQAYDDLGSRIPDTGLQWFLDNQPLGSGVGEQALKARKERAERKQQEEQQVVSPVRPWISVAGQIKDHRASVALKLFGFIVESAFTFIHNPVRVHPGTAFGSHPGSAFTSLR